MFYTTLVKTPYNARITFENVFIFHSPIYNSYSILFTWEKNYYCLSVCDCYSFKKMIYIITTEVT